MEIYNGELKWSEIRRWRGFVPSRIDLEADNIRALMVPNHGKSANVQIPQEKLDLIRKEFNELPFKNEQKVKELALKHNFMSGKWMIFVQWGEKADKIWMRLISHLIKAEFDDQVREINIDIYND